VHLKKDASFCSCHTQCNCLSSLQPRRRIILPCKYISKSTTTLIPYIYIERGGNIYD
jgi:hypothetical protein